MNLDLHSELDAQFRFVEVVQEVIHLVQWEHSTVHVSSTYDFQNLGGIFVVARALSSTSSMTRFATVTDTGDPIAVP